MKQSNSDLLYGHLNDEEIAKLNGRHKDLKIDDAMYYLFGEEGCRLADLCGDNMEEAEILIHGIYRGLDFGEDGTEDRFIFEGGKSNLEIRKYFSARKVRAIRAQTDLSQADFAKRVGLKRRTYQNYEEGQRIPSRLIVNAMQTAAVSGIYCIRSHSRLTLNLNLLSEKTVQFLEISMMNLYHFHASTPMVRSVSAGKNSIRMYWVQVEDDIKEDLYDLDPHYDTDFYPEDLAACIKVAKEYGCDEIIFEDLDHAIHGDYFKDEKYYVAMVAQIKEVQKELEKEENKNRERTYKLMDEYLADEASGDIERLSKWIETSWERERRLKEAAENNPEQN